MRRIDYGPTRVFAAPKRYWREEIIQSIDNTLWMISHMVMSSYAARECYGVRNNEKDWQSYIETLIEKRGVTDLNQEISLLNMYYVYQGRKDTWDSASLANARRLMHWNTKLAKLTRPEIEAHERHLEEGGRGLLDLPTYAEILSIHRRVVFELDIIDKTIIQAKDNPNKNVAPSSYEKMRDTSRWYLNKNKHLWLNIMPQGMIGDLASGKIQILEEPCSTNGEKA